jgi:hypothetical protein
MSESNLPALPSTTMEVAKANLPRIIKGNEIAVTLLKEIQTTAITNDEERQVAIEKIAKTKAVTDKLDLLIKETVGPLEDFIDHVKSYKKSIDYASKTKDGNEYTKAKAVIEAYDQAKAKEAERIRLEAEFLKKQNLYKAEIKEGIGRRLVDMISGQKKNIIDGMARWEAGLTLANFELSFEKLSVQKPILKKDKWEECFKISAQPGQLMTKEVFDAYLEELRKEYPYENYNAQFAEATAPILNEYRAKKDTVKRRLEEIEKASEEAKVALEQKRKDELEKQRVEQIKIADQQQVEAMEKVDHEKEMDKMNAEFTEQVQTQDIEDLPTKRIASFEDDANYLKPFAEVVGACALNPKFPGILKKNGTDYVDHVQWWLDWYAANCKDAIKGIKIVNVPKTIIRKK